MLKKIFLFDLDKTLITCDSLKQLIFFLFKKYPKYILFKIPSLTQIIFEHLLLYSTTAFIVVIPIKNTNSE